MRADHRERLTRLGRPVAVVVVLGLAASIVLRLANAGAPIWYTVALAAVLVGLLRLGRWTLRAAEPSVAPEFGPPPQRPQPLQVLAPVERRLANATRDRRLYVDRLRPALYGIARERVRHHGGPDLGDLGALAGSGMARSVLGEELWRWLSEQSPDGRAPSPAQVERLVSAVEAL